MWGYMVSVRMLFTVVWFWLKMVSRFCFSFVFWVICSRSHMPL